MATTTTRPARKRATPAAKATTPAQAVAESPVAAEGAPVAPEAAASPTVDRTVVQLEHAGTTKSYEKFVFPAGSGCTGNVYGPLGKQTAKVAFS